MVTLPYLHFALAKLKSWFDHQSADSIIIMQSLDPESLLTYFINKYDTWLKFDCLKMKQIKMITLNEPS